MTKYVILFKLIILLFLQQMPYRLYIFRVRIKRRFLYIYTRFIFSWLKA